MSTQIISFNCLLKSKTGQFISSTFNREVINSIDENQSAPLVGLARALQDIKKGEKRVVSLTAQEAYGFYDPAKVILFPRNKLPKGLRVSQTVTIVSKTGIHRTYNVAQFHDNFVSLDGNHPLAGQDLIFEIEALDARDATADEVKESSNSISKQLLN